MGTKRVPSLNSADRIQRYIQCVHVKERFASFYACDPKVAYGM